MAMQFDSSIFNNAFNQGASTIREKLKEERTIKAEALKQKNDNLQEASKYVADSNNELQKTIAGYKEERSKVMKDTKLTLQQRKDRYNELNQTINESQFNAEQNLSMMNNAYGTNFSLTDVHADTGLINIYDGKNGEYIVNDVGTDGMDNVKRNPDMYVEADDGNLYLSKLDENGKATKELGEQIGTLSKEEGADGKPTDFDKKYKDYYDRTVKAGKKPMGRDEFDIDMSKQKKAKDKEASYIPTSEEKNLGFFQREYAYLKEENPQEYQAKLKEFKDGLFNSITSGKGFVKDDRKSKQLMSNMNIVVDEYADYLYNPNDLTDRKELNKLRFIQQQNLSVEKMHTPEVKEDLKKMRGNKTVIDSIDSVLADPDTANVETDVAEQVIDFTKKTLGVKSEETLRNVDFTTKTGKILFTFINSLSGSAYTASEIEAYKNILFGGDLTDEAYVIPAIEAFRETAVDENEKIADRQFAVAPFDSIVHRQYSKTSPYKGSAVPEYLYRKDPVTGKTQRKKNPKYKG